MYTSLDGTLHIPLFNGRLSQKAWAQTEITLPAGTFVIQPHISGIGIRVAITDETFKALFGNVAEIQITPDGQVLPHIVDVIYMDETLGT